MTYARLRSLILGLGIMLAATAAVSDGTAGGMTALPDFASRLPREAAAVVTIRTTNASVPRSEAESPELPAGPAILSGRDAPPTRAAFSVASGFIVSRAGHILTNAHVVADVSEAEVRLGDGRIYTARVIGADWASDVALLKIDADDLPVAEIAEDAHVAVGDWVVAVGAPFGLERSATAGIVSAWPRYLPGAGTLPMIQTDVPIHPGSSGSPLFDMRGQVVGMNSTIYTRTGVYAGVGFAIPIDVALRVTAAWRGDRPATHSRVGLAVQPVTPELARAFGWPAATGALVTHVGEGSAAARAGLRSGDIVVGVGDRTDAGLAELQPLIGGAAPGSTLTLNVFRHGVVLHVTLRTDAAAADAPPARAGAVATDERFGLALIELAPGRRNAVPLDTGLLVHDVHGEAQRAGIAPDDVIVAVGDRAVRAVADFDSATSATQPGRPIALLVWRKGSLGFLALGPRP